METMEELRYDYDNIIDTLIKTFGNVLSRDVFITIIDSCEGDIDVTANAVMSIIMEGNSAAKNSEGTIINSDNTLFTNDISSDNLQTINTRTSLSVPNATTIRAPTNSYSKASRSSRPVARQKPKSPICTPNTSHVLSTLQIKHIIAQHELGSRMLILMRGVPGSGKSFLVNHMIKTIFGMQDIATSYHSHVLSTDDYFMKRGVYCFNRDKLSEAHQWNHDRSLKRMRDGVSPIIIDNTNVEAWEMQPYVVEGVNNGYIVEVVEPNTPWAKKTNELVKRNTHNVPYHKIRNMLMNYQTGITGAVLIRQFNCYYDHKMQPPVLRNIPPFTQKEDVACALNSTENELKTDNYTEVNTALEMEKVEKEWEAGEDWQENFTASSKKDNHPNALVSKPQRKNKGPQSNTVESSFSNLIEECKNWKDTFMPTPSSHEANRSSINEIVPSVTEKQSHGTCIEASDTNTVFPKLGINIVKAISRNINESHVPSTITQIPSTWMLHKSTTTENNELSTSSYRCKNEEEHFSSFRKLFRNVPRSSLRDIFDKCRGDVNWAVEIVLDGVKNYQLGTVAEDEEASDADDNNNDTELCQCLSAYGILPGSSESSTTNQRTDCERKEIPSHVQSKKDKIERVVSESSVELKRRIEQNVVIPDSMYSHHSLKIRKNRRFEDESVDNTNNTYTDNSPEPSEPTPTMNDVQVPSTSENQATVVRTEDYATPSTFKDDDTSSEDDGISVANEKTLNFNLGPEFVKQIDTFFGRSMEYPPNINCTIKMPISILNEINALWVESIMHQLSDDIKQSELMIQQDEEFARQLAQKELELSQAGKEPAVPDFREIMDLDLALSLYHKDVAEMHNNSVPQDLASKLSRDKLKNLFPEISPVTLSELLHAHGENFQTTVEVLLMSTGQEAVLDAEGGVNKFVVQRELELQQLKLAQEQKKKLSEEEWPYLPKSENIDMATVESFREKAEEHLKARNACYQKAQQYMRRGMTEVASYFSEVATFHKNSYEQSNSFAAAALIQVHAKNDPDETTIDLHFLRVAEARETTDMFLDQHIWRLRGSQQEHSVGPQTETLYIITGRGLHSGGRPRIKPAIKKRLRDRGLDFVPRNPGLLQAKVSAADKLTDELA